MHCFNGSKSFFFEVDSTFGAKEDLLQVNISIKITFSLSFVHYRYISTRYPILNVI